MSRPEPDDDLWERSMRLAEAANMDPMHGTPTPGRDFPEREPHPWVARVRRWLRRQWRKLKEWTL